MNREPHHLHTIPSPVGPLTLTATDEALVAIRFGGEAAGEPAPTPLLREAARELAEYFAGLRRTFTLPLAAEGTPFQQAVWQTLGEIPSARTRTYGASTPPPPPPPGPPPRGGGPPPPPG
ncbi:MAG: hypothetical protein K2N93_05565, partial [Alistipes sp.]|nr:hypothetical protein [Alistipes sp.]